MERQFLLDQDKLLLETQEIQKIKTEGGELIWIFNQNLSIYSLILHLMCNEQTTLKCEMFSLQQKHDKMNLIKSFDRTTQRFCKHPSIKVQSSD